ncbi:FlxA-like family protein [Fusibacter sp. 3D3]|uniref:FlxA-like family protein n=1 Tax=Fusibacter sp. 3D3 TaxID=1048380 RepID=UPI00085298C1|nr:FlxA-like family protein [Fusibacter sp. 3D3]GAU78235.1 hypothetical protein F3D3_2867 [Fusibacter sp. 3D3]
MLGNVGSRTSSEKIYSPAQSKGQDSQIKAIQNQIKSVQEQIQKLSENKTLDIKEKAAKLKTLQENLQELNRQLVEKQAEIAKNQNQNQNQTHKSTETTQNSTENTLELDTMKNVAAADQALSMTKTLNAVKNEMSGRAQILKIEIKIDRGRGDSTKLKEDQLSGLEKKINSSNSEVSESIGNVNHILKKSTETRQSNDAVEEDDATLNLNDEDQMRKTEDQKDAIHSKKQEKLSKKPKSPFDITI